MMLSSFWKTPRSFKSQAAALCAVLTLSGCSYGSDLFDFVSWESTDGPVEPVALSNSQLDALRAQRDQQIEAMNDPSYKAIELDLPDLNRLSAGHIEAMQRGAAALISDGGAIELSSPSSVDAELDALIAAESARKRAARENAQRPAATSVAPTASTTGETFVIGSALPTPQTPPATEIAAAAPPSAEQRAEIRRRLVEREEQAAVRRQIAEDDLAQRLHSGPAAETVASAPAAAAPEPVVLPAAVAPTVAGAALLAGPKLDQPVSPGAATPDVGAAAPSAAVTVGGAAAAPSGLGGSPALSTAPDVAPAAPAGTTIAGAPSGAATPNSPAASIATAPAAAAPEPESATPVVTDTTTETAAAPASAPVVDGVVHVVGSDETLAAIASDYGTTPAAIRAASGLGPSSGIYVGQELTVPNRRVQSAGGGALPPSASDPLPKPLPTARVLASPNLSQYRSDRAPQVTPPVENGRVIVAYGQPTGERLSTGVEIEASQGAPVRAASDGQVAYLSKKGGQDGGSLVLVHADGMITRYGRLQNIALRHGERVRRGQQIAEVGPGGSGKPARLRFELLDGQKPVDPTQFFIARATQ